MNKLTEKQDFNTKLNHDCLKIIYPMKTITKCYQILSLQQNSFSYILKPKDRPVSVILKNVPIFISIDEFSGDIQKYNLPILKITWLTNCFKPSIPVGVVELANDKKTSRIYKIKDVQPHRGNNHNLPQITPMSKDRPSVWNTIKMIYIRIVTKI